MSESDTSSQPAGAALPCHRALLFLLLGAIFSAVAFLTRALCSARILPKKPFYGSRLWFLLCAAKALELRQMCVCVCVWWGGGGGSGRGTLKG